MLEHPERLILVYLALVFSCVVKELARIWTADKLGDPSPRLAGRMTLNPLPHMDLFWTVLMPLICLASPGGIVLGGPKPAPINPFNFRNPRAGVTLVAIAGPGTHLALAGLGVAILTLASRFGTTWVPPDSYNAYVIFWLVTLNVTLAALNLIPLPPFDGGRILHFILGSRADRFFATMEQYSFLIVLMVLFGLAGPVIAPALRALVEVLAILVERGYLLELVSAHENP